MTDKLNTFEVAERLGVDHTTIVRMCRDGRLPATRFGTGAKAPWQIAPAAVAEYQARHRGRNAAPVQPGHYTVADAAEALLYEWRKDGKMAMVKLGGYWYVADAEVEEHKAQRDET